MASPDSALAGRTAVTAAAADPAGDIYVSNATGSGCTDLSSASGSENQPFCTISAAARAAQPGQTVIVEPGSYSPVTISVSGTPGKPITLQGGTTSSASVDASSTANAFLITGAHDVVISGFNVASSTQAPAYEVTGGSSDVTIDGGSEGFTFVPGTAASSQPVVEVDSASDVTISRGSFITSGAGVVVNSGASGVVVTGNTIFAAGDHAGVAVTQAPGTDVTGNTLRGQCGPAITLAGGSGGASIQNNIVSLQPGSPSTCTTTAATTGISVSADSTAGTVSDYNLIDPSTSPTLYDWAGSGYTSLTDFTSVTAQGSHDIAADPGLGELGSSATLGRGLSYWYPVGSNFRYAAIDSANANAPGALATDQLGSPRTDNPNLANAGAGATTYFDRGAIEAQGPMSESGDSKALPSGPLTVTATQKQYAPTWTSNGSSVAVYSYQFDDLRFPVITTASTITHTYLTAGAHTIVHRVTIAGRPEGPALADYITVAGAGYTPVTPRRILDTRNGTGVTAGAVPANGTLTLSLPAVNGVAATAMSAVVMNVTVLQPQKQGYLTVFPGSGAVPTVSNLSFAAGQAVPNLVAVQVSGGKVSFHNGSSGTVQVVADLAGYYGAAGNGFMPQTPVRVLDTRTGTGAAKMPLAAGEEIRLNLVGKVPAGTAAVVLNVTVTQPQSQGWLSVFPDSGTRPNVSNLSFTAGETIAGQVIVPLANGVADLYNGSPGTVHVLAELDGYYSATAPGLFVPYGPVRLADTRSSSAGPVKSLGTYTVVPQAYGCSPAASCPKATAAVLNLTALQPTQAGYLTVYPAGAARPVASSVNFAAGQAIPNLVTAGTGAGGAVTVYNGSGGTVQLVADQYGYFVAP